MWKELSKHQVVSMEQIQGNVKQLVSPKREVTLYCSLHQGKELDLYCETCGELICLHCTVKKHKDHQYDLVGDTFEKHKAEITASLEPVENQLSVITKALEKLDVRSLELDDLQATLEANIQQQIQNLQELLEARKAELIDQLQQLIQVKKKNLAAQKDEVETVHTQLASCLSFVRESLRIGSQGEVMKMKKAVVKQIKEMTDNFKPDMLPPCEPANVKFVASSELASACCQQFGKIYLQQVSPEKCHATGKGLEVAKLGERTTTVLHVVDGKEKACTTPVETLTCELVSEKADRKINCSVKTAASGQYEISYQATSRGRHQLHIKVEEKHIKGSPFPVTVKLPVHKLGTPIRTIGGIDTPTYVVVNQKGNIIVAEYNKHCISIFSPAGEKIKSFGSFGSSDGKFNNPRSVVVDDDDNILVTDGNNQIQKFTSDGKFITAVGKHSDGQLKFYTPRGIGIQPHTKKVYVVDLDSHRIQILNPDLTFSSSFGSRGSDNGQFNNPWDVAFDKTGNVYIADGWNYRIQVFSPTGQFLRKFGRRGKGNGELDFPNRITIDSDDVIYVTENNNHRVSMFTCEGKFLTSFGTNGNGPGQFECPRGVVVDEDGVVIVCDERNNRLQYF